MIQYAGLWLLVAIAFNMWAWLSVIRSGTGLYSKLIWTAILAVFPGIGYMAWYLIGPRELAT